jgi:hypothetical protein
VWDFLDAIELSDLIESIDRRRETTMKTEDLSFNHCCKRKIVEQLSESLPDICISILSQTLVIETIAIKE